MSKRKILALAVVMAAFTATGAFAHTRIGFGTMFDTGNVGSGEFSGGDPVVINYEGFGVYGFLDTKFMEFSVGLLGGSSFQYVAPMGGIDGVNPFFMNLSVLGKFPFYIDGHDSALFPLLGFGYDIYFGPHQVYDKNYADPAGLIERTSLNPIRFQLGAGADYYIASGVFLRGSIVGSYRVPHTFSFFDGGFGATFKLGLGFR